MSQSSRRRVGQQDWQGGVAGGGGFMELTLQCSAPTVQIHLIDFYEYLLTSDKGTYILLHGWAYPVLRLTSDRFFSRKIEKLPFA